MKKTFVLLGVLLSAFLLASCSCEHEWDAATCVTPRTCNSCGETQGEALGHNWQLATCLIPQTCSVCGQSQGSVGEHQWESATCETPQTCLICEKTQGTANGHVWKEATCTSPILCSVCSHTDGKPLGHSWKEATCTEASTCLNCGQTSGKANGHTVHSWSVTTQSTCREEGTESGICTVCGEQAQRPISLKDHIPGDWEVTVSPTASTAGKRVKKCIDCGHLMESEEFTMTEEEIKALYINKCQKINYKDLERNPGEFEGEYVKFSGYVVQVCSEASSELYYSTYRVATYGRYDNVVYIYVDNYGSGSRILEDDYVTFYGKFDGLYTYTTVRGDKISIPSVKVEYID